MVLKNYTTSVPARQSIAEIEVLLVLYGASNIIKEFKGGEVQAISFVYNTSYGNLLFKLSVNAEQVRESLLMLKENGELPKMSKKQCNDIDVALKIAWRNLKDWITSQLTLIELHGRRMHELFLPYAYDQVKGKTVFELFEAGAFKMLAERVEDK